MLATSNFVNTAVKNNMNKILNKNHGFEKMCQFGSVLSWKKVQGLKEDSNAIANFSCAMMSMDFKGAFSTCKNLLSTKRNCFMEAHLKDQMLIQWNQVFFYMKTAVSGLQNHLKCRNC